MCARWRNGENGKPGFVCFLEDVGDRPSKAHSLDRRENNGNYEPSNCRWVDEKTQQRNRRNNQYVEIDGKRTLLVELAERLGVPTETLRARIRRGMTPKEAVTTPIAPRFNRKAA